MKFNYEYRTSDNVRHVGIINAADKAEAYSVLKAQGIKPGRVEEAPGFFNKLFGKGKRWITISVLAIVCIVALCTLHSALRTVDTVGADLRAAREEVAIVREEVKEAKELATTFEDMTRRQVIGDVAIIEKGIATGWEDVFPYEGERFLASFAIPGVPAGLRNTTEEEIRAALRRTKEESIGGRGATRPTNLADLSLEHRQIVFIVEGMKNELREFIADGKHTIVEYGRRLVERQEQELAYYNRAKTEINAAAKAKMPRRELLTLWEERNAQLRQIGVKLVPIPEGE